MKIGKEILFFFFFCSRFLEKDIYISYHFVDWIVKSCGFIQFIPMLFFFLLGKYLFLQNDLSRLNCVFLFIKIFFSFIIIIIIKFFIIKQIIKIYWKILLRIS